MTKIEKPEILVNTFGSRPPKAAESFGSRGATSLEDIRDATDKRRESKPGQYDHKR
jgi:hypothetical protein